MDAASFDIFSICLLIAAAVILTASVYTLIRTDNFIKMIITIEVMMKAVTLLLIFAGLCLGNMALVQTYIVTIIVCEVAVAIIASGIAINSYRKHGSLKISALEKLKG